MAELEVSLEVDLDQEGQLVVDQVVCQVVALDPELYLVVGLVLEVWQVVALDLEVCQVVALDLEEYLVVVLDLEVNEPMLKYIRMLDIHSNNHKNILLHSCFTAYAQYIVKAYFYMHTFSKCKCTCIWIACITYNNSTQRSQN